MPEPRAGRLPSTNIRVTLEPETRDSAAARRRQRAGRPGYGRKGAVAIEIRNGLPFRPYIYRGLGYDQYGGDDA